MLRQKLHLVGEYSPIGQYQILRAIGHIGQIHQLHARAFGGAVALAFVAGAAGRYHVHPGILSAPGKRLDMIAGEFVAGKWRAVQKEKVDSTADSITVFWATWINVVDARAILAAAVAYHECVSGKWRAVQQEKVDSTADSITVFWQTWQNVLTARAILAAAVAYHAFVVGKWESVQDDKLFARSTDSDYALFILNYARAKRDIAQEAYDSAVNAYYLAVLTAAQTIDEAIALDAWNANEAVQRPILLARSNGKPAVLNAGSFTYTSDGRLKKNVVSMDGALDSLDSMCGVYHHWNDENQPDRAIGVIAQDVQQFYPELVAENSSGLLSVNYPKLAAVLLQSIKELKAMVLAVIERRKAAIANAQK